MTGMAPEPATDLRVAAVQGDEAASGEAVGGVPTGSSATVTEATSGSAGGSAEVRSGDPDSPGARADGETVTGPGGRALWRRYRVIPLVLLVILLVALVIGVARTRSVGGRLDPRGTNDTGARALATLLTDRGVPVRRATEPASLTDGAGSRTVVFVPFPDVVAGEALRRLGDLSVGTVVLVGPESDALGDVTGEVQRDGARPEDVVEPGCSDSAAQAAGAALTGGNLYRTGSGDVCYAGDADGRRGAVVTGRTRGGARLVVLGTATAFTNDALDEDGNAALGLNLLGADGSADEVRWLVPTPGSALDEDDSGGFASILPDWIWPAAVQLLVAGLLLVLWRGRRLGPPVTEPLPVVVRAAEAVEGRARLYRRARARDRAADALRAGALARLVPRLGIDAGVGGDPAPVAVVAAVAGRTRRPDAEVHAALYGPAPVDDAGLVALSETLDSMVRTTLDPEVPQP